MKQKVGITILCAVIALVSVSCSALWTVENKADISFSLSKEALTAMSQASNVRSIDADNDIVTATISLHREDGSLIDSENVILEDDEDVTVEFIDLAIIGENVYARIEATIDGVKHEGVSETKRMIAEGNTLRISVMNPVNKIFTITFNANGGTVDPTSKMVLDGMPIGDLPIPSKADSTFSAWQIEGASISSDTVYTYDANKEAIAIWDVETYTVSFDTNGGTELEEIKAIDGSKIAKPADPKKENHALKGWYTDEALTTPWNFDTDVVSSNMTLYAAWSETLYTITFDANGGSGSAYTQTFYPGIQQELTPNNYTAPSGKAFVGWAEDKNAVSITLADGVEYTATESKTFYAVWKTMYTVTFNDRNGNTDTQEFVETISKNLKPFAFAIPAGKGFAGWSTTNGGTTVEYTDEEEYTATENINLYAVWADNITNVRATLDGTVLTVTEDPSGTTLKVAMYTIVNDTNRSTITKIVIEQPISGGRITPEADLSSLFTDADGSTYYEDLTNIEGLEWIDTSNVTDMNGMFKYCMSLTSLDLSGFDTSNVTDMGFMFNTCQSLTSLDLSHFNTANVTFMNKMFSGCSNLTSLDLSHFNTANVRAMGTMFSGCSSLTSLDLSSFDTSNVIDMSIMFNSCKSLTSLDVSHFNTANVTGMNNMFNSCESLTSLDLSSFDTSKVTSMGSMFSGCSNLTSLDVSNLDTAKVTSMGSMFSGCSSLSSLDLSSFDTSIVTSMYAMFSGCRGLTSLDVSHFDTAKVTSMGSMFSGCSGLTSLDVSRFNTTNVTDMRFMFINCSGLTSLDVSHFNGSSITSMGSMFYGCSKLAEIQVPKGATFVGASAFYGCTALTKVVIPSTVTDIQTDAFKGCTTLQTSGVVYTTQDKTNPASGWEGASVHPELYGAEWKPIPTVTVASGTINGGGITGNYMEGETVTITADAPEADKVFKNWTSDASVTFTNANASTTTFTMPASNVTVTANYVDEFEITGVTLTRYNGTDTYVTIPASVTIIGANAFQNSGIVSIDLNNVTSAGTAAFFGCESLKTVTWPSSPSFTEIPQTMFKNCTSLVTSIPSTITTIGYGAFENTGLTTIDLSNVTSIESNAFSNCKLLTSITLPTAPSFTEIPISMFNGCSALESIYIPSNITTIDNWAFAKTKLASVIIPEAVNAINLNAFNGCASLTSVTVERDTIPLTTLGSDVFKDTHASLQITVPVSVVGDYKGMAGWSTYADKIVSN